MKRLAIILLIVSSFCSFQILAQKPNANEMLQKLGASNYGKEFWFTIPPCFEDESMGFSNFIKIFVISQIQTNVTVEIPGKGYLKANTVQPYDVFEFNITPLIGQPFEKNGSENSPAEQVFAGLGIHVYSDYPVVVYCVVRYHWTSDGFLVIPVSSLGREYIVAGHEVDPMFANMGYKLPNSSGIVAAFDDTQIRFYVGGNSNTKTTGGKKAGDTLSATLMRGDVFMVSTETDGGDLSGSRVVSTKPIAVVTGNMCANVPIGNQWCDYIAEMDIPTFLWGNYCHVPKIPKRKYSSMIKIFAKEPDTKIYRNGISIGNLSDKGGIQGKAFLMMRMKDDLTPGSVVISGDKPISVTLYNTGVQEDGSPAPNSDPFMMAITPHPQYAKDIMFCTPGINGGAGFSENYVNIVYEKDENGFVPDSMMIAGPVMSGNPVWKKVKDDSAYSSDNFSYDVEGKSYGLKCLRLPSDGVYFLKSATPFAAYSIGYSDYDSYGYPTGTWYMDQEKHDEDPPAPAYNNCCGDISDGVVTDMPDNQSYRSNLAMIAFHPQLSFNYIFKYDNFVPGDSRTTNWQLNLIDPTQEANAVITFADRSGNDSTIVIHYDPIIPEILHKYEYYGIPQLGNTITRTFTVYNQTKQDKEISNIVLKDKNSGFTIEGLIPVPFIIKFGDSVHFSVKFDPTTTNPVFDSIGVEINSRIVYLARVEAGNPKPMILASSVDFGLVEVGKVSEKTISIQNQGYEDLILTKAVGPSTGMFGTTFDFNESNPQTIKSMSKNVYNVSFTPKSGKGQVADTITYYSNASDGVNKTVIYGIVGEPVISVSDILLGTIYPNVKKTIDVSIGNKGNTDLIITDFIYNCVVPIESMNLLKPSQANPWTVKPGDRLYVTVTFRGPDKPQGVYGTLTYVSNSQLGKSTVNVIGTIISGVNDKPPVENLSVSIYPNPTSGKATLSSNTNEIISASIEITDLNGRLIETRNTDLSSETKFDFSTLSEGVYIMNVKAGKETIMKKFTIKK